MLWPDFKFINCTYITYFHIFTIVYPLALRCSCVVRKNIFVQVGSGYCYRVTVAKCVT